MCNVHCAGISDFVACMCVQCAVLSECVWPNISCDTFTRHCKEGEGGVCRNVEQHYCAPDYLPGNPTMKITSLGLCVFLVHMCAFARLEHVLVHGKHSLHSRAHLERLLTWESDPKDYASDRPSLPRSQDLNSFLIFSKPHSNLSLLVCVKYSL